jgi:hypothetical protein
MPDTESDESDVAFKLQVREGGQPLVVPERFRDDISKLLYDNERQDLEERLRLQSQIGMGAVRSIFLVNGGAIIGLLTFLGNSKSDFDVRSMHTAFIWFLFGLFFAVLAPVAGFLSQTHYQRSSYREMIDMLRLRTSAAPENDHVESAGRAERWLLTGLLFVVASFACFAVGSLGAVSSIDASPATVEVSAG